MFFSDDPEFDGAVCPTLPEEERDVFFGRGRAIRTAKAICRTCPVTTPCLKRARENEQDLPFDHWAGVWGGLSVVDRIQLFGKAEEEVA